MTRRQSREIALFVAGAGLGATVAGMFMARMPQRARDFMHEMADTGMQRTRDVASQAGQYVERGKNVIGDYMDRGKQAVEEAVQVGKQAYRDTLRREGVSDGSTSTDVSGPGMRNPGIQTP